MAGNRDEAAVQDNPWWRHPKLFFRFADALFAHVRSVFWNGIPSQFDSTIVEPRDRADDPDSTDDTLPWELRDEAD
jgi:hypothetical protein